MRRADRLFELLQVLRRARGPITAAAIADELETSERTVYRDVAALIAADVPIRGEAGVGYVLDRRFHLPPLMFDTDELEALALGAQWVMANTDPVLARAARDVIAKVMAAVPAPLGPLLADPVVGTPPRRERAAPVTDPDRLRTWTRQGRTLWLEYADAQGEVSQRTVWPFLIGYGPSGQVLVAWCTLRADVRIFRLDRVRDARFLDAKYPESPSALRRRWLASLPDARDAAPTGRDRDTTRPRG